MGATVSQEQMNDYREVVKDRLSEDAIAFLYKKFMRAAPSGLMTPPLFKQYIDSTGVYKNKAVRAYEQEVQDTQARYYHLLFKTGNFFAARGAWFGARQRRNESENAALVSPDEDAYYLHLFRGYDLDGEGVITFKKFLVYHVAIMYSTEELFYIVFNTYDEDGDGYLSFSDIRSVIEASTRYVGDCDVRNREVQRVIDEEARRLMAFLDIRKEGLVRREDMRLITQKYPQILEKMKCLM